MQAIIFLSMQSRTLKKHKHTKYIHITKKLIKLAIITISHTFIILCQSIFKYHHNQLYNMPLQFSTWWTTVHGTVLPVHAHVTAGRRSVVEKA